MAAVPSPWLAGMLAAEVREGCADGFRTAAGMVGLWVGVVGDGFAGGGDGLAGGGSDFVDAEGVVAVTAVMGVTVAVGPAFAFR
jgi:hypothetical protein